MATLKMFDTKVAALEWLKERDIDAVIIQVTIY
jgi:hypothetical protein